MTKMWFTKGQTFGDLFKDGSLQSFQELSSQHGLPRTNFFKYLQVRHFVISEQGGRLQPLEQMPLDTCASRYLCDKQGVRRFISYIYLDISQLMEWETLGVKRKWEEELEWNCKEEEWEALCKSSQYFFLYTRHKITQYNLIHIIYYTPERLHKRNVQCSQFCQRCKSGIGKLLHLLWACPCLNSCWPSVLNVLTTITGITITAEPKVTLLL